MQTAFEFRDLSLKLLGETENRISKILSVDIFSDYGKKFMDVVKIALQRLASLKFSPVYSLPSLLKLKMCDVNISEIDTFKSELDVYKTNLCLFGGVESAPDKIEEFNCYKCPGDDILDSIKDAFKKNDQNKVNCGTIIFYSCQRHFYYVKNCPFLKIENYLTISKNHTYISLIHAAI